MDYDVYGKRFDEVTRLGLKAPERMVGQITAKNVAMARLGATITINNKKLPVMVTRIQESSKNGTQEDSLAIAVAIINKYFVGGQNGKKKKSKPWFRH